MQPDALTLAQAGINASVQVGLVLLISLTFWAVFGRKKAGFWTWIGLTLPPSRAIVGAVLVAFVLVPIAWLTWLYPPIYALVTSPNSIGAQIALLDSPFEAVAVIVVTAVFTTALAEEILFRGLIAKRFMNAFGFQVGNAVQASLFTALHLSFLLLPNTPSAELVIVGLMVLIVFPMSWLIGWLNETVGRGSTVPGWIAHALANLASYTLLVFH